MATAANKLTKIMKGLECKVCMELLDKPKLLTCCHTFCQDCIDCMMTFNPDGSSEVKCPNRCANVTHISKTSTTNDLTSNYAVIEQLDAIEEKSKGVINKCSHRVDCTNEGSVYCATCNVIMCLPCKQTHNLSVHNNSNTTRYYCLVYDRKDEKTKTMCRIHGTKADFYCCGDLICLYCKKRSHRTHAVETVTQQVIKIREDLSNKDYYGLEKVSDVTENILITKKSIDSMRVTLQEQIKHRKQQSLLEYIRMLNAEEVCIMATFEQRTQEQIKHYPTLSELKSDISEEKDFAVLLNKDKIASNKASSIKPIPIVSIKLTTASANIPLGDIHVKTICSTSANVKPAISSVVCGMSALEKQEYEKNSNQLVLDLTELLSQVLPSAPNEEPDDEFNNQQLNSYFNKNNLFSNHVVLPSAPNKELDDGRYVPVNDSTSEFNNQQLNSYVNKYNLFSNHFAQLSAPNKELDDGRYDPVNDSTSVLQSAPNEEPNDEFNNQQLNSYIDKNNLSSNYFAQPSAPNEEMDDGRYVPVSDSTSAALTTFITRIREIKERQEQRTTTATTTRPTPTVSCRTTTRRPSWTGVADRKDPPAGARDMDRRPQVVDSTGAGHRDLVDQLDVSSGTDEVVATVEDGEEMVAGL